MPTAAAALAVTAPEALAIKDAVLADVNAFTDGKFIGAPDERDPLIGVQDHAEFTIPKRPIRRRMTGLPDFVVNRGGEYCFMPGLPALRWLADLDT